MNKAGIYYSIDSSKFGNTSLNEFTCYYDNLGSRYEGPSIIGTDIEVFEAGYTESGIFRFTVKSRSHSSHSVQIELLNSPKGSQAFQVITVDNKLFNITYAPQESGVNP